MLIPAGATAAVVSFVYPFTPAFSASDSAAASIAALVTASAAVGIVPLAQRLPHTVRHAGAASALLFTAALLSAGAAAIHLAVAKMHFDQYTLFGVFFLVTGLAQLAWALWLLWYGWRPLLLLGALGNAAIVAMWGVDRIWGVPLGPAHWKPDPVGFGDVMASVFEVLLVASCTVLLARGTGRRLSTAQAVVLTPAVVALTTLALLSILGVGSSFLTPTV